MMDVIRHWFGPRNPRAPHAGRASFRVRCEALEPRRLLSAEPAAVEIVMESTFVAGATGPGELTILVPTMPLENRGEADAGEPSAGIIETPAAPDHSQNAASPGGLIDIAPPEATAVDDVFVGPDRGQEARDVLDMLASLKFVPKEPDSSHDELFRSDAPPDSKLSNTEAARPAFASSAAAAATEKPATARPISHNGLDKDPPTELNEESIELTPGPRSDSSSKAEGRPPAAVDQQSSRDAEQGGLMVLMPYDPAIAAALEAAAGSRPEQPVEMDTAYGKFQAFEVSTVDEEEAPPADDSVSKQPVSGAAAASFFAVSIYVAQFLRPEQQDNPKVKRGLVPSRRHINTLRTL